MELTLWTYEGPPHVGAMRVAASMKDLHYVLHAPQGDTYADLLFTMIERRGERPPVTYTTFQARDLGEDTANLFKSACQEAVERFEPEAIIVGASCTAELIQDDPGGLAEALGVDIPVIALELPSYQRKENFGADETFYQIVKKLAKRSEKLSELSCNILGPTSLGFRHRDDVKEVSELLSRLGIKVNVDLGFYNSQGQWFQTLGTKIQKLSNVIHQKTLRGGANFLVCSPTVATVLESIPGFASTSDGDVTKASYAFGIQKAGNLNNRYTVYKNPYMTENVILMGYRGSQFLETGAVFAPYVPLIMTPLVYDPDTFTPRKGLLTRYAKKMIRPEFYGRVFVNDLNTL